MREDSRLGVAVDAVFDVGQRSCDAVSCSLEGEKAVANHSGRVLRLCKAQSPTRLA